MLSDEDVTKIRKLKDDLDQEEVELKTATRETEKAKDRIKQVRSSIRPAARTRFFTWLTNSDPEENRRYRAAIAEHKDQILLVGLLKPKVAAKDARITAALRECLAASDETYQDLTRRHRNATDDQNTCDELRGRSASLRSQVDAALTQIQQLRDPKDARKAMKSTVARITGEANALSRQLAALASRMRAYGSFPAKQLRAEFSSRSTELTATRAALDSIHSSLTSASKHIANHKRGLDKKRSAIVQQARVQALGS